MSILRSVGSVLAAFVASAALAAEARIEVARIVDQAAAEAILGVPVKPSTPVNVEGKDGYYSKCNYYSVAPGKLLILRFYQAAAGFDVKTELDQVRATSGLSKTISGLGDRAEMEAGAASGFSNDVTMLYVIKGNALLTVGLRGLDEEAAGAKAKSIAQKILERL
ncbi:MAG: hypothetical protein ABJB69_09335 [Spartobacteria bacterium]